MIDSFFCINLMGPLPHLSMGLWYIMSWFCVPVYHFFAHVGCW